MGAALAWRWVGTLNIWNLWPDDKMACWLFGPFCCQRAYKQIDAQANNVTNVSGYHDGNSL